jgi:CO/xanthine dehydrogenase FAD-binding subunit
VVNRYAPGRAPPAVMPPIDLRVPATEAEALAEITQSAPGEVAVVAGGTDLLLDLDDRRLAPRRLVSLRRLPWNRHGWDGGALTVGSTEPLAELEVDPALAPRLPALAQAIAAVGSPPLRRQATFGGNLGRSAPASDLTPVLLALDARVELLGAAGPRWLPVDTFLHGPRATALAPGELIRSIRIPEARPSSAYLWQRVRPAHDISQIGVAVAYAPRDRAWRLGLGGVPPRPVLVPDAAAELRSPRPGAGEVAAAAERLEAHPGLVSDRRASDEHRRRLAAVLCDRAVAVALSSGGSP